MNTRDARIDCRRSVWVAVAVVALLTAAVWIDLGPLLEGDAVGASRDRAAMMCQSSSRPLVRARNSTAELFRPELVLLHDATLGDAFGLAAQSLVTMSCDRLALLTTLRI